MKKGWWLSTSRMLKIESFRDVFWRPQETPVWKSWHRKRHRIQCPCRANTRIPRESPMCKYICEIVRPTEHFLVRNPPWTQWAPSLPGGDLGYRCLLQGPHREEQVQSECKKQLQTHWHNLRCKHFASQLLSIPVQYGNKFLRWVRPCPQRYATLSDSDFITSCLKSNSGRHSPTSAASIKERQQ